MNKKIICMLSVIFLTAAVIPASVHAVNMSAGVTTWYTNWGWTTDDTAEKFKNTSALMYGPVLSVSMTDRISLSFLMLYGKFSSPYTTHTSTSATMEAARYDIDAALNFRIGGGVKIFAGIKSIGFDYAWDQTTVTSSGYGPGAGISISQPITGHLFLIANLSGMYIWSTANQMGNLIDTKEYGFNSSLALAYYIPDASTTISLGGRYQRYLSKWLIGDDMGTLKYNHVFYGVTLTAIYSFKIGSNENE